MKLPSQQIKHMIIRLTRVTRVTRIIRVIRVIPVYVQRAKGCEILSQPETLASWSASWHPDGPEHGYY